ncbi:hypothetical protein PGT21_010137 [Puccinia graminis f. sp. tritici]|uniref:Uncharacterized protein n=1 Tax=Puccinia graminis f. sp. tritici TaxID=56615 RepID=A0A5B0MU61_PUCGR|nr:hypothetical protein PGT21_010137 [Puccinia graminis f. sp. tritici]
MAGVAALAHHLQGTDPATSIILPPLHSHPAQLKLPVKGQRKIGAALNPKFTGYVTRNYCELVIRSGFAPCPLRTAAQQQPASTSSCYYIAPFGLLGRRLLRLWMPG